MEQDLILFHCSNEYEAMRLTDFNHLSHVLMSYSRTVNKIMDMNFMIINVNNSSNSSWDKKTIADEFYSHVFGYA